jgi:hypothetical protein
MRNDRNQLKHPQHGLNSFLAKCGMRIGIVDELVNERDPISNGLKLHFSILPFISSHFDLRTLRADMLDHR